MKTRALPAILAVFLAAFALLAGGCGDSDSHSHETEGPQRTSVCGFSEGRGVFVGAETRAAIKLAVADALAGAGPGLLSIPESSLLSTATGNYVFAVNGDHFQRTEIEIANRTNGWIAVSDGLLEGDQVVTNGVRELWRIELQATKGGYACCAVEKRK